jgi:cell division control protein 6
VYQLVKEQSFLGMTESEHTGGGYGEGSFLKHRLVREPELIAEAVDE